MSLFNPAIQAVLDEMLLGYAGVRAGKMFGFPAYYAGAKLCICLYEQGVGVKLPEISASRLLESDANVVPFQPLGRARMRAWVQINAAPPEAYREYRAVFEESIGYVLGQQAAA